MFHLEYIINLILQLLHTFCIINKYIYIKSKHLYTFFALAVGQSPARCLPAPAICLCRRRQLSSELVPTHPLSSFLFPQRPLW